MEPNQDENTNEKDKNAKLAASKQHQPQRE